MTQGSAISQALEVRVPGKAILAGEHFVLYGVDALAAPVPTRSLILRLAFRPGAQLVLPEPFYELSTAISTVLEHRLAGYIRLFCTSEIPQGAGLGSSAAFSVALGRALVLATDDGWNRPLPQEGPLCLPEREDKALEIARILENRIHGKASGIDTAAVASPGGIVFSPELGCIQDLGVAQPIRFLLVDTGVRRATRQQVEFVARHRERSPELFRDLAEDAGAYVSEFRDGLAMGDRSAIWRATQGLGTILSGLGLEPASVKGLRVELASKGVALKVTGAGGGGYLLGFAEDDLVLDDVVASMGDPLRAFCFSVASSVAPVKSVLGGVA